MPPLKHIKVLDLSRILAGPWCTQTLADLGAEVWKVESFEGDDTRLWMPPDIDGQSTYFLCCNRSKKSLVVDLKHPDGQAVVRALATRADVLVENFKDGGMERFGLGYDSLAAANPGLVFCSISGYGRTGPRRAEAGYDFAIQAESGLMSITGEPDGAPMKLGVAVTDIVAGMNAVQAILAAIIARQGTGKGQRIDISLLDGAVALLANVASGHLATGGMPQRLGNAHPTVVPYQLFSTSDGALALAVGNDRQFRNLCEKVLRRPELAVDPRFATNRARVENRGRLIPVLEALFLERGTRVWVARLREAGVPVGEVREVASALASPEIAARDMVATVSDPVHGTLRLVGSPLALRGTPTPPSSAPPQLGADTATILSQVLGLDAAEIGRLRAAGAIGGDRALDNAI